jgi:hypothetical protein
MYINAKILHSIRKIYYKFKMLRKNVSIYISLEMKTKKSKQKNDETREAG